MIRLGIESPDFSFITLISAFVCSFVKSFALTCTVAVVGATVVAAAAAVLEVEGSLKNGLNPPSGKSIHKEKIPKGN